MWGRPNSQEVGLEAAILERKRNSSLVESARAEDVTGLEAVDRSGGPPPVPPWLKGRGRGAVVGERSVSRRRSVVTPAGGIGSANADMSNDKASAKLARRKPKGSCATVIGAGSVGP